MRRGEDETVALEWRPQGKMPKERPRKRWIDEEDLKTVGVEDWRQLVPDR